MIKKNMTNGKKVFITTLLCIFSISTFAFGLPVKAEGEPSLTITSPLGGETYQVGDTVNITWNQTNVDTVTIGYKVCDPGCLDWIVYGHPVNISSSTGQYSWIIPSIIQTNSAMKIEIIAYHTNVGSVMVKSPAFTIINSGQPTPTPTPTPNPTPISSDAYKAVVKVNTFGLNTDFELKMIASGSGVILKSDGTLLTNYHVIESEDSFTGGNRPVSFQICVPLNTTSEPDCSYTAKLVAVNKDMDLAILKIQAISGLSTVTSFPFIDLKTGDVQINDTLNIIGYPEIGDETVTSTTGVVSGTVNKYGSSWIKTDALISFGNSGGAALDAEQKLVGIATAAHSDVVGSLGYIINVNSFRSWILAYSNAPVQESSLLSSVIEFTKKQKAVNNFNIFFNPKPAFSITKNPGWEFIYSGENSFKLQKNGGENAQEILVNVFKLPYKPTVDNIIPFHHKVSYEGGFGLLLNFSSQQSVTVGSRAGKKVTSSFLGENIYDYWFPHGEYLVNLTYGFGASSEDRIIIESMIQTLTFSSLTHSFTEQKNFSHTNPMFSLASGSDWAFKAINDSEAPVEMNSKSRPEAYGEISLKKIELEEKNNNNEAWLEKYKQEVANINQLIARLDLKSDIAGTSAHNRLSTKLNDVIMVESIDKKISTGEVLARSIDYYYRSGDVMIRINMTVFSGNQDIYNSAKKSFNSMLQSMTLTSTAGSTGQTSSSEERVIKSRSLYNRLKGNILLKVEDGGKAYYVHPSRERSYYLGKPQDAFAVMRQQGVGIKNSDLRKIPIGIGKVSGSDQDQDGLSDLLEDAIGSNKLKVDSDDDGNADKVEVINNYNPQGSGRMSIDLGFAKTQQGRILLQVESKGEAWYVSPKDNKRYFLGRAEDAFSVMRSLGMGINNQSFNLLN